MRFKVRVAAMMTIMALQCALAGTSGPDYRAISVRDFAIEGPKLARLAGQQGNPNAVEISGFYVHAGELDELFESGMAVVRATEGYGDPVYVPLLTEYASPAARGAIVDCRSSPSPYCRVVMRGFVVPCQVTHLYGSGIVPCLSVMDGNAYIPPPPTAEQIAQAQAAAKRAREDQVREIAEAVNTWEIGVENCLINSPLVHARAASSLNANAPALALGHLLQRVTRPAETEEAEDRQRADNARRLYETCASKRWPPGAAVPDQLPPTIQTVINQCLQGNDNQWRFCTENNPPRP